MLCRAVVVGVLLEEVLDAVRVLALLEYVLLLLLLLRLQPLLIGRIGVRCDWFDPGARAARADAEVALLARLAQLALMLLCSIPLK